MGTALQCLQSKLPLWVYLRLMGLWGLGTLGQPPLRRLGCWDGASLPPTATGVDALWLSLKITVKACRVAIVPLVLLSTALPEISFFSPHRGKNSDQHHCPGCMETKRRVLLQLRSQVGWKFLSVFFKTLHQVIQNKLRVYFGLRQSCRRRLTLPAGCPRQGLTLSIPFCRAGGECFHS